MSLVQVPAERWQWYLRNIAVGGLLAQLVGGCDREFVVGTWSCPSTMAVLSDSDAASEGGLDEGGAASEGGLDQGTPAAFPWSTGFEDGFCGYQASGGFCYSDPDASFRIVTSPVHSGRFAAAFTVDSSTNSAHQARCVRQGILPSEAYYGAWYFVPTLQANTGVWNLFHFQGGTDPGDRLHGLWDLSLINDADGNLNITVFDFLGPVDIGQDGAPNIPIGSWFHLQIYLRRTSDATGEVTVLQDGKTAYHLANLITDDSSWGQWYVGNFATGLMPVGSTIYVDDVEMSETP